MRGFRYIFIGLALILLLWSCSDNSSSPTSSVDDSNPDVAMTLSEPSSPSSVDSGDSFQVEFNGAEADAAVEATYVYERPDMADSTISRTLTPSSGEFSDSFAVDGAMPAGTHTLRYSFSDSDNQEDGSLDIFVNEAENSPASFEINAPDMLTTNTDLQFTFTAADADSIARFVFIEGGADSTVFDNVADTLLTETISRRFLKPQEYSIILKATDSKGVTAQKTFTFTVIEDNTNSPASFDVQAGQDLITNSDLEFTLTATDTDGIERFVFVENGSDSTVVTGVAAVSVTEVITRRFSESQEYTLLLKVTDSNGITQQESFSFTIARPEDNTAQLTLQAPSGRGAQSWSANVTDADGIQSVDLLYVRSGQTDTIRVPLTITGTEAFITLDSPSTPGAYDVSVLLQDTQGNTYHQTKQSQILAELADRTLTVQTPYEDIEVSIEFDFNGQQASGITNTDGNFSATVIAPADSLVKYLATADALGLQEDSSQDESAGNITTALQPQPVPITIATTLPGQYPRTSDVRDLSELVIATDKEGTVPVTLDVLYIGSNFVITNISGTQWEFTTSQDDPANLQEVFELKVIAPFSSDQQEVTKEIFPRRGLDIAFSLPTGEESSSLVLENFASNYIQSSIAIDSVNVESLSANLAVEYDGDNVILTPDDGFYGMADISIYAENRDGFTKTETRSVTFNQLPRATIDVINSVTNQPVESYLLFWDTNDAVIDSLVSSSGTFTAAIPSNATALSVAEKQGGQVKSFEHYVQLQIGQPFNRQLAIEDFRNYSLEKTYIDDISLFDMKRFKWLMDIVHGKAPVINLDGTREGSSFGGVLHRATESKNGIGYDLYVISDTTDWVLFDETGIMEPGTSALVKNVYETEIAPIMGQFAPPVEIRERIVYDHDNPTPNVGFFNPRLLPDSFGSNAVLGKLPFTNQHSLAQLLSDANRKVLSDEAKTYTALQEITSGNIYFTGLPADFGGSDGIPIQYQFRKDESAIHNNGTRIKLSKIDRRAGWMIYEPLHNPGEKIDNLLRVPNQIKAEYNAL